MLAASLARPLARLRVAVPELAAPVSLALFAGVLYIWAGVGQGQTDGWFPLAQSMLHGSLSIDGSRASWIELAPAGDGRYYLPFPPIPAVVLMPIVALFGPDFVDTSATTGLVGGLNVLLVWFVMRRFLAARESLWLTAAFAFGSEAFYVAATGGVHLWTETLGMSFELAALALAVRRSHSYTAGILLLLAAGCRPTYLLAAPAFLLLYGGHRFDWRSLERPAAFLLGAAPVGILLLAYNAVRFGSPLEFGYDKIVSLDGTPVTAEWWYSHGIMSLAYVPQGLYTMFLTSVQFVGEAPWFQPSWTGMSILLTMPALLWLGVATWRSRLVLAGWLGLVLPLALDLCHGLPGYAQFGYRFVLDGLPFAWLLLALVAARYGLSGRLRLALVAGCIINAYGLWAVTTGFVGS